ncbi:recombinase RecQ [Candidatus Uhrbacteria bacterium CG10_big_fil_rev_8_21_14_0_10_48_11]|uniref:ATP-dependent DNA helicase RecQ n=1 Tax=Candidatus Uhrbacteria bacterium CG10_big_fil_rev_8_21_14_0_10_48_11 TaxID=1975037 RepID=A0A2M8LDR3_9BACT|nr:MAG: recombinase RecQ [Candidatus Uhrbacteria bacterium CG10_big_fil_rev_8_21_14_0_10_48_11]
MATEKVKEFLANTFGYQEFRRGQEDVVAAVLAGRDVLVVMPTGAGKSLCYQLPALLLPGLTLVVSPLIALMKDQVDELNRRGVAATFINSSLSPKERSERTAEVLAGRYQLLYVAPERFYDQPFVSALAGITVSLFAVDEAHCISEWGHDFRPSYLRLRPVLEALHRPPVIALTATATPDVREDIVKALALNDPLVVVTGFDRPNLTYGVIRATPTEKIEKVLELVERVPGPAIVYGGTRDTVDTLREVLEMNDISVAAYHAGMDKVDRAEAQRRFMNDEAQVMVATNAFGLGIDKANIRLLVHFDLPGTLEAYYQEAGRAGRDGKPSYAVLLYHPSDRYLREFFIEGENPSPQLIREVYRYLTQQVGEVIQTTYSEILAGVGMKAPELAVSTAMKTLEHAGYLKRPREGALEAKLQLLHPLEEVDTAVLPRAKVQRQVWELLRDTYQKELENGISFSVEELIRDRAVSREAVSRSLRALNDKGVLVYQPPFRGQEIRLLERTDPEKLDLDWVALRAKRRRGEQKLALMETYAHTSNCRRAYVLHYLGDRDAPDTCAACDNCMTV